MFFVTVRAPTQVERAVREGLFIPLTELTHTKRQEAVTETEALVLGVDGSLKVRPLDSKGQERISQMDWLAASEALVGVIRSIHGDAMADIFEAHFTVCRRIVLENSFEVAVRYDIQQRNIFAFDGRHDFSTLDTNALSVVVSTLQTERMEALHFALRGVQTPCGVPTRRNPWGNAEVPNQSKRPRLQQPSTQRYCFRCGKLDHLPITCKEENTITGRAVAPFCTKSSSRNALLAPSGKSYCFHFARGNGCRFENHPNGCNNYHGCSICGESSHGAGKCPAAKSA